MRLGGPNFGQGLAVALLLAAPGLLLASAFRQQNPETMDLDQNKAKARQLLKQAADALGGPLYRDQRQSDCQGRVAQFDRNGSTLGYTIMHTYWEYPDKNRSEYVVRNTKGGVFALLWGNLPIRGSEVIQLMDGDKGWTMDKGGVNDADVTAVSQFQAALERSIRNLVLHRADQEGVFLHYAGIGTSDMREVEWVDFSDDQDRTVRMAIDRLTHLPLRTIATTPNEEEHDRDEDVTIYSNYRELEGIQTPMQISREHNGRRTHQIFFTSCTNAPNLPPDFFTEESLRKRFKQSGAKTKEQQ